GLPQGPRTMSVSVSLIRKDDREPLAFVCAAKDITEQKQAEQQMRIFGDTVQNMQDGVAVLRLEDMRDEYSLRLLALNPSAARWIGRPRDEVISKPVFECFPDFFKTSFP